jgi:hypothetical protein
MLIMRPACVLILVSKNGIAMRIVPSPLLRIRENFVSGLNGSEELCCILDVAKVTVRMQLEGFTTVSFLDP